MSSPRKPAFWFPAKTYGWGWGPPNCWQGWAVIAGFLLLDAAGAALLIPVQATEGFIAYTTVLTLILIIICWRKGEPLRWRWGK